MGRYAHLVAILLLPVAAFVGAVTGGISGAAKAEPAANVEEAEAALKNALTGLKIQETIRGRVLAAARAQTRHPFVLREEGPSSPDETPSYRALAREGIDTILETRVEAFGLAGEWRVSPPVALTMTVRTRLVRVSDDTEIYGHTLEYRSVTRPFTAWAADNAQPFREELDRAYRILADKIVEELFLLYLPREMRPDRVDSPISRAGRAQRVPR